MKGKDEDEGLETVSSTNPEAAPAPVPAPEENPNSGCMYYLVREHC